MKKSTLITLITVAIVLSAQAADKDVPPGLEKKGGVPPGLQKKDKLPPGIAKKQGKDATAATPSTPAAPGPAAPAPNTPAPATPATTSTTPKPPETKTPPPTRRELRADITKHARTINTLDNKAGARRAGYEAIAKETGVSVSTLQAQQRQHQEVGTAGLLMANVIAGQTKRPAGNYLRQAAEGKPWERIAADNGVNLEDLDAKLGRLEEAMRNAK